MTRKQSLLTLLVVGVVVLLGAAAFNWLEGGPTCAQARAAEEVIEVDADEDGQSPQAWAEKTLGIVQNGQFLPLAPERAFGLSVGLTAIRMQEAIAPEAGELDLTDYEGKAIMVRGHDAGGWIYSATVVDHAGPILTAVVERLFVENDHEDIDADGGPEHD